MFEELERLHYKEILAFYWVTLVSRDVKLFPYSYRAYVTGYYPCADP